MDRTVSKRGSSHIRCYQPVTFNWPTVKRVNLSQVPSVRPPRRDLGIVSESDVTSILKTLGLVGNDTPRA